MSTTPTAPEAPPSAPPVIATIPPTLSGRGDGLDILVRHEAWGVAVDVRPAGTTNAWTPLTHLGGTFEVRAR